MLDSVYLTAGVQYMTVRGGGGGAGKSSLGYRIPCLCPHLEWHANGRPAAVEEQPGQALLGSGGLHDLLQCHPWLPLLPAQDDLPHMQEEIPLSMPGTPFHNNIITAIILCLLT